MTIRGFATEFRVFRIGNDSVILFAGTYSECCSFIAKSGAKFVSAKETK